MGTPACQGTPRGLTSCGCRGRAGSHERWLWAAVKAPGAVKSRPAPRPGLGFSPARAEGPRAPHSPGGLRPSGVGKGTGCWGSRFSQHPDTSFGGCSRWGGTFSPFASLKKEVSEKRRGGRRNARVKNSRHGMGATLRPWPEPEGKHLTSSSSSSLLLLLLLLFSHPANTVGWKQTPLARAGWVRGQAQEGTGAPGSGDAAGHGGHSLEPQGMVPRAGKGQSRVRGMLRGTLLFLRNLPLETQLLSGGIFASDIFSRQFPHFL